MTADPVRLVEPHRPSHHRERSLGTADLQREIAAEQAYLDRLYDRLDVLRKRASADLAALRRSPIVPTPAGRAERDAFDAWHSERLGRLTAVEDRLAFGRLDLVDGERRHIGRIGLSDDNQVPLLVDWRAPAAAAFYQATAAAPDGVLRRRHLATRARTVIGLDDEVLDDKALARRPPGSEPIVAVAGEGALMAALTARRTSAMRDIVATLQSEQDQVVRAPLPGVLVVAGGPGTGKTAVALHRAAYLLYTHRDRIARSGVLVVGPTPVFLRYIEQVLPGLGESGVVLATPGELFPGVDARDDDPPGVAVVKGDLRMAAVVRAAVRMRQRLIGDPVPLRLDGDMIHLRPHAVAAARARARQTGRPHNEARVTFVHNVLEDLVDQLARVRGLTADDEARPELMAELRSSLDVRREVNLCWMPLTAQRLLADLYASAERLADAAAGILEPDEQALLRRERRTPWTRGDVALLDEAAELIGDDEAVTSADRARAAAARAEALAYARGVLEMSGDGGGMVTPEMLADRFAEGGPVRTLAERAQEDRTWVFGHAVVDEAQELSAMQWRLLMRRVPSRSMTVVGDVAQTGSAAGARSWSEALDAPAQGRWRISVLSVNYRTPGRVMELAGELLAAAGVEADAPRSAREGDWEPIGLPLPDADHDTVAKAVATALAADDAALPGGRFAVIVTRCDRAAIQAALRLLEPGLLDRVSVHTPHDVKGLEFDAVAVVDPAGILAESARGVNDLYVALTRPTQRLTVLHHGDLPPGLEGLDLRP